MPGGFRLFRLFGIDVSVHWLWIVVVLFLVQRGQGDPQAESIGWRLAEVLSMFGIVLMHEFGHALACRSVGGRANHIMLWPLGGVAFVDPPPRPGATLWSIVAGPLVNVALLPVTWGLYFAFAGVAGHDLRRFLWMMSIINTGLLIFNMLPIYPLDGGQILRSLLWFAIGRARSLRVASIIGICGAVLGVVAALMFRDMWLVMIAAFAALQSFGGLQQARMLGQLDKLPKHRHVRCPSCGGHPPIVATVRCACGRPLDPIATPICPTCARQIDAAPCPHCGQIVPMQLWLGTGGFPVVEGHSPYEVPVVTASGAVSDIDGR
jgi:Zn-dependent protease